MCLIPLLLYQIFSDILTCFVLDLSITSDHLFIQGFFGFNFNQVLYSRIHRIVKKVLHWRQVKAQFKSK